MQQHISISVLQSTRVASDLASTVVDWKTKRKKAKNKKAETIINFLCLSGGGECFNVLVCVFECDVRVMCVCFTEIM